MAFEGPYSSSHLGQYESRNSPNSVSLKQKALGLKLVCTIPIGCQGGRRAEYLYSFFLIAVFCFLLLQMAWFWAKWRIEYNDVIHLVLLCVSLVFVVGYIILNVGQIILFLLQNVIQQKIQQKVLDDEEEIKIGAPTWFLCVFGCCLFSFLAAKMGWQTNNYLGINKHPDSLLLLIHTSLYCFALVSLIILALVFFFVMITYCYVHILANTLNIPVNVATTLDALHTNKMPGLRLFCISPIGYQGSTRSHYYMSVILIVVFYSSLLAIGWLWAKWRIEGNDVFHLILLCVTLGVVAYFILMVGKIILWWFKNAIRQKVQVLGDVEEEIRTGPPFGLPCLFGCCLFSVGAAIMGWQTNNYLEKGINKQPGSLLLLIYASPYCFGFVSSIALALVSFFVMMTSICARILANTLNIPVNALDIKMPGPSETDPAWSTV